MVESLVKNELKIIRKEAVVPWSRYYPGIFLEGLDKSKKIIRNTSVERYRYTETARWEIDLNKERQKWRKEERVNDKRE
jgi:hypothetical protein